MSALGVWHLEPDFDVNCFAFGGSQLISSLRNEPISCHTTSTAGLTNSGVGYSWKHELSWAMVLVIWEWMNLPQKQQWTESLVLEPAPSAWWTVFCPVLEKEQLCRAQNRHKISVDNQKQCSCALCNSTSGYSMLLRSHGMEAAYGYVYAFASIEWLHLASL